MPCNTMLIKAAATKVAVPPSNCRVPSPIYLGSTRLASWNLAVQGAASLQPYDT